MFIENFSKIYGTNLHTIDTMYEIRPDTMTIAPSAYTMRLAPKVGRGDKPFTIVITKMKTSIKCGIYVDREWNPIEIFDMSRMDLKTIDTFKKLLSYKIQNHE